MLESYLSSLGYGDKEIDMFINTKELSRFSDEELCCRISDIFEYMLSYGYEKDEIINMSILSIKLFSFDVDMIIRKINNLSRLGYRKDEIIKMTVKYPNIFVLGEESIKIKKIFYDKIGILDVITKHPVYFSKSFDLVYARYVFYYRMGIKITKGNYSLLFLNQRSFINRFGKTNEQLIAMYNYDEIKAHAIPLTLGYGLSE